MKTTKTSNRLSHYELVAYIVLSISIGKYGGAEGQ